MAVATKPRKAKTAKQSGPPIPTARKELAINATYELKAKELVRDAMKESGVSINELHGRLEAMGVQISAGGLANKISRGGFSAMFMLQCMDALDIQLAPVES